MSTEPLKVEPNRGVMNKLKKHDGQLGAAAPTWHEMWSGCFRLKPGKRRREIEAYLRQILAPTLPVLSYSARAAQWHAEERARLSDGQIASIAVEHELTLVTANVSDFRRFRQLHVVDWHSR